MARSISIEIDRLIVATPMSRRSRDELTAAVAAELTVLLQADAHPGAEDAPQGRGPRRPLQPKGRTNATQATRIARDIAAAVHAALPARAPLADAPDRTQPPALPATRTHSSR